jgi:hypothetical protein
MRKSLTIAAVRPEFLNVTVMLGHAFTFPTSPPTRPKDRVLTMDSWPVSRNSRFGSFAGGTSQADSEKTKNSSKGRDNGSGNGSNFVPVSVNKMADWDDDQAAKSGAIFLWLMCGYLAFTGCFWWLLERRIRW